MNNRRAFLKRLGIGTIGALVGLKGFSKALEKGATLDFKKYLGNDELYWKAVGQSFHLKDDLVYLNNGTMGPSPSIVEKAVIDKIKQVNSNLGYGGGEDCRDSLATLIGASQHEITITHNTTEGLNVAAWGLPLQKGDEVIMTSHEHVGNAMPWLNRAHHDGIVVKTFNPLKTHTQILEQINGLITANTRVITIPHISCTIGQLFPIKAICQLASEKGIFSVIDGAHGAGALSLNMADIKPDVYVSCCHKWLLGPKGTGFAFVSENMFDVLKPVFAGAYTDSGFDITVNPPTLNGYAKTAHRYDYGTQNAALKYGIKSAADFHLVIGKDRVQERVFALNQYLYEKLMALENIELLSSSEKESRSMMLGFKHKTKSYKDVASELWKGKFRIRQVPESGVDCIRVSTHIYNNFQQLDDFVLALKRVE